MTPKIFLSYKSEDAVAVRMIAEQLRCQGIGVWFAEYNITMKGRLYFQELIDAAISDCDFGVCFTNDLYADSEYCRREVEQLLLRLPPENIIEIAFPRGDRTHQIFPQLSGAHFLDVPISLSNGRSVTLSVDDANRILNFISESTGTHVESCLYQEPGYSKRIEYRTRGIRYSIDLAGWSLETPGLLTKLFGWSSLGPMYKRQTPDGHAMWGRILSGPQDVWRKNIGIKTASDRGYYEEALKFAQYFFENARRQHCAGVHLLFAEGLSHPAFTTISRDARMAIMMGKQTWERLYSVVLPGRWRWSRDIEFAFYFFVRGNLETFLRSAHIMDRLVLSIRLE